MPFPTLARRFAPDSVGRDESQACKRGCCWTPHGHSTAVDNYPPWHPRACLCHTKGETHG